jgi:hypothetical protein
MFALVQQKFYCDVYGSKWQSHFAVDGYGKYYTFRIGVPSNGQLIA